MIGRNSLWFPVVLLLFLAGISFWLNYTVQGSSSVNTLNDRDPESIVENFEAIRTDPQGRIKEHLFARKLSHFSGSKLSEIEGPRLVQIVPGASNMTITAGHAVISHDSREVSLEQNVVMTRAGSAGGTAMVLTTARLLAYPERDLLRAPGPVVVKGAGLELYAAGMEIDSKRRIIKLTGRVKARYLQ